MTRRRATLRFAFRLLSSVALTLVIFVLSGCGPGRENAAAGGSAAEESPDSAGELPELAAIGGVQDVWAFPFGLDADREGVRSELGEPVSVNQTRSGENEDGPTVIRWFYERFSLTFLVDATGEQEYLLSARLSDPEAPLRGGLRVGMPVDEAIALLGEPRVASGDSRVWFYLNSTIELVVGGNEVEAVVLSRALP